MRKIKFRGMDYNKEWVFGGVSFQHNRASIHGDELPYGHGFEVDPKTVSQFTGIRDKNGREIYEGDIVTIHPKKGYEYLTLYGAMGVVEYSYGSYIVRNVYDKNDFLMIYVDLEVIGNIYEPPDLLDVE